MLNKKGIIENESQQPQAQQAAQKTENRESEELQDANLGSDAAHNEKLKRKKIERMYSGLWIAKVIEQGQSFGDIALMTSGERYLV